MTVSDLTLGLNQGTTKYGPFSYGSHAGEPVVDFSVSESKQRQMGLRSIDNIFQNNNWKRKIDSGFARLQYNGKDVFNEEQTHEIAEMSRILNARFVDFELSKNELQHREVPREIRNIADYYRIFVPENYEFNEELLQNFAEESNGFGNVEFLFKVESESDEKYVNDVVREYSMYDSDVWLFPKGRKAKTVSERMQVAEQIASRKTWNLSPRLGILANAKQEIVSEE
jgi:hypothetical protein